MSFEDDFLVKAAALAADLLVTLRPHEVQGILGELAQYEIEGADTRLMVAVRLLVRGIIAEVEGQRQRDLVREVSTALVVTWPDIDTEEVVRLRRMAQFIHLYAGKSPMALHMVDSIGLFAREPSAIRADLLRLAVALSAKSSAVHELADLGAALHRTLRPESSG